MRQIAVLITVLVSVFCLEIQAEAAEARAVIRPYKRAVISSEIAAKIVNEPFREGDSFKQGDLLIGFDCGVFKADLDKVAAELEAARFKLKNDKELEAMNSIGAMETVMDEQDVKKTEAELRIAQIAVDRCSISAPFNGYLSKKMVNEHESVKQQQELLEIISMENLEAVAIVPASWVSWLKEGRNVSMYVEEAGRSYPGKVTGIIPTADPVSQTIQVRIMIPNSQKKIYPGMSGKVRF